ncbi:MAG: EAL domain-containing protein, partial [Oscillospiraceae bacterium]
MLLSILNKTISGLSEEELNMIAISNVNKIEYKISFFDVLKQYSAMVIALFLVIIVTCVIVVAYHKNKLTKKLKTIAYRDPVTGGRNIEKFKIDAKELFAKFGKSEYTMIYFDIDRFKYINDILGHDGGNELLSYVISCLDETLYQYEIAARLSADNFLVLLKERTPNQIGEFITSLLSRIEKFPTLIQLSQTIMISAGAYRLSEKNESVYEALDKANIARRLVKGLTGRTHAFYDETMQQRIENEVKIVESMQIALDGGEFEVYFQPKRDIKTGKLAGAEALIRWNQDKKIVPPDEFITLFEKNGFITKVDFFVFEQVCKMLNIMQSEGKQLIPISVNLSRVHMQSRDFIGKLKSIANKYEIPLKSIELELTETVFLQNITELKTIMRTL